MDGNSVGTNRETWMWSRQLRGQFDSLRAEYQRMQHAVSVVMAAARTVQSLSPRNEAGPWGMHVPVVHLDRTLSCIRANPSFAALAERSVELCPGQPLESLLPHLVEHLEPLCRRAMESHRRVEIECSMEAGSATDTPHWYCATATPCPSGVRLTLLDISEPKSAERDLADARDAALTARDMAIESCRARDQMLATVAHELRTPLVPVCLEVQRLIREPETSAELRASLEMIQRNLTVQSRLIHDLTDVVYLQRGTLTVRREPVDLHMVIRDALSICRPELEEARQTLQIELDATQTTILGDGERLLQLVWNLLRNAARYSSRPGTVTIRTHNQSADGTQHLVLIVNDTGPGIAPEEMTRIFAPFERGEASHGDKSAGFGIGLSLARLLAAKHGGALTASSPGRGQGSSFILALPLPEAPAPQPVVSISERN